MTGFDFLALEPETQEYFRKVIEIFLALKDKYIVKDVEHINTKLDYVFTNNDKKLLALYIAAFYTNGDLKNIVSNYDNLRLDDILEFAELKEEEIKAKTSEEYSEYYEKYFKVFILSLIQDNFRMNTSKIVKLTPETLFYLLCGIHPLGSNILNYYSNAKKLGYLWFEEHPVFSDARAQSIINGSMKKDYAESNASEKRGQVPEVLSKLIDKYNIPYPRQNISTEEVKDVEEFDVFSDNVWDYIDVLEKKFIGQEETAKKLYYTIVDNIRLASSDVSNDGSRAIIFLDGPSGTGKTAIIKDITEKLGVPFITTAITNYSSTGYKGGELTDIIQTLINRAGGDIELAQKGIVVLDEFDKVAAKGDNALELKKAVQQELLDLMGGGKYIISGVEFDTSKLTFACLGALSDLRKEKTEKKNTLGFSGALEEENGESYNITPEDLESLGMEPELVNRLNTYLHTEDYSKEVLKKIFNESLLSPKIWFENWFTINKKKVFLDDAAIDVIVEEAYKINSGARSLQTVMHSIKTALMERVLRGVEEEIYLDSETISDILSKTRSRQGRR